MQKGFVIKIQQVQKKNKICQIKNVAHIKLLEGSVVQPEQISCFSGNNHNSFGRSFL